MERKIYLTIIILILIASVAGYWFYHQGDSDSASLKQACLDSGGKVVEMNCCEEDFPNLCKVEACGCSPQNSEEVKACNCGDGKCFNGEECVKQEEVEAEANFEKEGYLVKFGQEGKWALNYEEPGKPALVVTLKFNEESNCDLVEEEKPCLEFEGDYGEVGDRVKVVGNKEEDMVEVRELIYVK